MNGQIRVRGKNPGEINLIHAIDARTKELLKGLNATENIIIGINKNLLPIMCAPSEDEQEIKDKSEPFGWFERHLVDLDVIICRATRIHLEVDTLNEVTKTDKVG